MLVFVLYGFLIWEARVHWGGPYMLVRYQNLMVITFCRLMNPICRGHLHHVFLLTPLSHLWLSDLNALFLPFPFTCLFLTLLPRLFLKTILNNPKKETKWCYFVSGSSYPFLYIFRGLMNESTILVTCTIYLPHVYLEFSRRSSSAIINRDSYCFTSTGIY